MIIVDDLVCSIDYAIMFDVSVKINSQILLYA